HLSIPDRCHQYQRHCGNCFDRAGRLSSRGDANTSGFLESEFMFATQRWMKLDIERVVTKGTYGPAQEASAWMREPIDLSKVDEVGFADLIRGSGHGAGGYVNVASFEVYGKPVKRH